MITEEQIQRINELARKQKSTGLTEDEKAEQAKLRRAYIDSIKGNIRHHVEGIKVVDETGKDITPEKLKQIQKEKGLHGR